MIGARNEAVKRRDQHEEETRIHEIERIVAKQKRPKRHPARPGRFDSWKDIDISQNRYGHDGRYLVTCLFHFLWIRKPSFISSNSDLEESLGLPDTMLFDRSDDPTTRLPASVDTLSPSVWYFTSIEDGKVRRKGLEAMADRRHVVQTFSHQSRHIRQVDIVAKYMLQTQLRDDGKEDTTVESGYRGPTKRHLSVQFLDKKGLDAFIKRKSEVYMQHI